jgi:transposase
LYSPQRKAIIDILESRRKDFLIDFFAHIPGKEKQNVQYVSIDMWDNYRQIVKLCLPSAYICVDSFHVIKQLNFHFNKVRIRVMKRYDELKKEGHEYYWLLKKFWKFLLMNLDNLP